MLYLAYIIWWVHIFECRWDFIVKKTNYNNSNIPLDLTVNNKSLESWQGCRWVKGWQWFQPYTSWTYSCPWSICCRKHLGSKRLSDVTLTLCCPVWASLVGVIIQFVEQEVWEQSSSSSHFIWTDQLPSDDSCSFFLCLTGQCWTPKGSSCCSTSKVEQGYNYIVTTALCPDTNGNDVEKKNMAVFQESQICNFKNLSFTQLPCLTVFQLLDPRLIDPTL